MKLDRVIAVRNNKTVYRDGDRRIKVFSFGYSKQDVLNEALNHARIEDTGLRVPEILEVTMIDGKWAIVTEFIKGKTLAQLMAENEDKKSGYLELFVDLQVQIHSKTCHDLNKLKDSFTRKILLADIDEVTRAKLLELLGDMPAEDKICHGDFTPDNIIIGDDGTPYILDWAHAAQGDVSADGALTYLRFLFDGDAACADDYLGLFCEKSNISKQYVKKQIPLAAASQLIKSNEKEREFFLSHVNVTDLK